jgi:hypothetical protein
LAALPVSPSMPANGLTKPGHSRRRTASAH